MQLYCGIDLHSNNAVKRLTEDLLEQRFTDSDLVLAMDSNRLVMLALDEQIRRLEKRVLEQARLDPRYQHLLTIHGIGKILALTIMLETGDITDFENVGNFSSYCRCVGSQHLSNGKKKGSVNNKNGNRYLAGSFHQVNREKAGTTGMIDASVIGLTLPFGAIRYAIAPYAG